MLSVVLLSIRKYALNCRVCARDTDKLDPWSSDHSVIKNITEHLLFKM